MAKKRGNPLSGKFRDPPQEGNASVPAQADQDVDQVKLADTTAPEQTGQEKAPIEQIEAPAEPMTADVPAQEQADQGEVPAEQTEAPAEPVAADVLAQEQADQGEAPAEQTEAPVESVAADAPAQEQANQGEAPTEQTEPPTEPVAADTSAQEQADRGEAPAEQTEAPAEPVAADALTQEQADQGEALVEQAEVPAEPVAADTPDQGQADQGETPVEQTEAPAEPVADGTPTQEQTDRNEASAEQTEAPADPMTTEAPPDFRFVKLDEIKSLPGTYVKDTPREDYSDLINDIKKNGLEKPIILRRGLNDELQLVDGFHRCEALKQAGFLDIKAMVYDMSPREASRYRRDHRASPNLPIPGKLLSAHPPKEKPAADKDAPAQDEEEFEIPEDFVLPITKPGQAEIITTLKVDDIHPFENHPFNVIDECAEMKDLTKSVIRYGVLEPVMVINRPAGGYEMVSGHRRMRACQLAGIQTIPAIVRNLDRDEAIIAMVDANLKREITPMERARAYKMKTDAMKRKIGRRSKAEAAAGEKPLTADEELAKQTGESVAQVQRIKSLNKLVPEMQEMVDKGKIPLNTGVDIAQMKPAEQKQLADAIQREDKVPTGAQVKELKKQSVGGTLTTEAIKQSVAPTKREENPPLKVTLVEEDLRPYFPDKRTTTPDVKKGIFEALALRQKLQERQKAKAQQTAEAKDEAKPPDKPAAGDDKKPAAPAADTKAKAPAPQVDSVKKSPQSKKPANSKPKKSNLAR